VSIGSIVSCLRNVACLFLATASLVVVTAPVLAATSMDALAGPGAKLRLAAAKGAPVLVPKAGGLVEVVEFYNAGLQHYFISGDPAEVAVLDGGAFGGAWKRTGNTFPAWDVNGAPANTVPVCRFFGTDQYRADGSRIGPNSHFYTADPSECAFVKTAWQSIAGNGLSYPAWTYEADAFAVVLPVAGACPAGTQPLYRTYNDGARGDPNHRYSLNAGQLQAMAGWSFEGLVMCLPQGTAAVLPTTMGACGTSNCPAGTPLGNGAGLVNIVVQIANTSVTPIDLVIPAGLTFVATPATVQNGVTLERLQATIAPGTTRTFVLAVFCANASRAPSNVGATYAPGPVTGNANLLDLASLAEGKLGEAVDPLELKSLVLQYALWEITDGRGTLTPAQRSLLVTILATQGMDPALPDLLEQFFATLSVQP
jgi:hypothetical protein